MSAAARAAIRRLRNGVVPDSHVEQLSVGYQDVAKRISRGAAGAAKPLFVRGEWGTGKTHFFGYVRVLCRRERIATAIVALNARTHAVNYPQRFYPALTRAFEWGADIVGVSSAIEKHLSDSKNLASMHKFASAPGIGALGIGISLICDHRATTGAVPLRGHLGWSAVVGDDLAWGDYDYKKEQALSRLAALGDLVHAMSGQKLVLLLDELETIDQLWSIRSRMSAYEVLGRICRMASVWPLLAITRRFAMIVDDDARTLRKGGNLAADASWFLSRWLEDWFDQVDPPTIEARLAQDLADRVAKIYLCAYGTNVPSTLVHTAVESWVHGLSRNPRTLIRRTIDALDQMRPVGSFAPLSALRPARSVEPERQ